MYDTYTTHTHLDTYPYAHNTQTLTYKLTSIQRILSRIHLTHHKHIIETSLTHHNPTQPHTDPHRHRHMTHTDTQTHTHTQTHKHTNETHTNTYIYPYGTYIHIHTDTHTHKHT